MSDDLNDRIRSEYARLNCMPIEDLLEIVKKEDENISFLKEDSYYHNLIFNGSSQDVALLQPELEWVETPEQRDIWLYFRKHVSMLKISQNRGRTLKILVRDILTLRYLGILELSGDALVLASRDQLIGWNSNARLKRLKNLINIQTCVPLQPFGFNFCGGKLLAELVFTREVCQKYQERYGDPLLGVITTSLYGKSIQYDRLPHLKLIGYTTGKSCYHIPEDFYQLCRSYATVHQIPIDTRQHMGKLVLIERVIRSVDLPPNLLEHGIRKGIYFGYTSPRSQELLRSSDETINTPSYEHLSTVQETFTWWLRRWALKRYQHLQTTQRLQYYINLNTTVLSKQGKNLEFARRHRQRVIDNIGRDLYLQQRRLERGNQRKTPYQSNRGRKDLIDEETLNQIRTMKGSYQDIANWVATHKGINVNRSTICRWLK